VSLQTEVPTSDATMIIALLSTVVIQLTVVIVNVRSIRQLLAARYDWRVS
jgi:hypothetical protein